MPKDNENIPLLDVAPVSPSEPQGFKPDQMVRCEQCLRANPPTRSNCLYCAGPLPFDEKTAGLQTPSLRRLERWESGYNNILAASIGDSLSASALAEAARLLKLNPEALSRILSASRPLPLARTATPEEASLVQRCLEPLGLPTTVIADEELSAAGGAVRVRGLEIREHGLRPSVLDGEAPRITWSQLLLFVTGRLVTRRVELKERKGGSENEIIDASELFSDEALVDIYTRENSWRIMAHSFDFSCLLDRKTLTAGENFSLLLRLFRERAPQTVYDDSYNSLRPALDVVWPAEQQVESRGWRRERPGKVSIGAVAETSNETQFTRFSQLSFYLCQSSWEEIE